VGAGGLERDAGAARHLLARGRKLTCVDATRLMNAPRCRMQDLIN
jgi:hypothetical protein